jgi:hypothetical protein
MHHGDNAYPLGRHPTPRDPARVSADPELVIADQRVRRACHVVSTATPRGQQSGPGEVFASLLAWAQGLLGG